MKESLFTRKTKFVIFFAGCCTHFIVGWMQFQYQIHEHKKDFDFTVNNIIRKDISDKLSTTKGVLTTLVSYYQATHDHSSSSFSHFSGDLLSNYHFLTAIGIAKIVNDAERTVFVESMLESGFYDFRISRYDADSESFVPALEHKRYAPLTRVEPPNYRLTRYFGYDLLNSVYFQDGVHAAIESSRIVSVYNHLKTVDLQSYYFLKATYEGELIPETKGERLEKVSGIYIVNVDIKTLLLPIKQQFPGWFIDIPEKTKMIPEQKRMPERNSIFILEQQGGIDEMKDIFLHVQHPLYLADFDLFMPVMLIASTITLQVMVILLWRKDLLIRWELNYQAKHDDLTGLPNRTFLRDKMRGVLEQLKANPERHSSIAVVFIDLDHFKEVNDSYGHQFGDALLIEIAGRFQATLRKTDTICRLGGDEFIVLLDTVGDDDLIITTIERIMGCMEEPIIIDSRKVYPSASFGVATFPDDGEHVSDLMKNADTAMYKAKENGRAGYCFYNAEMTEKAIERLTLETKLRQVVADDAFEVYYQPQLDGRTGTIIGFEALVRWFDTGILISPDTFIPLAEETGVITSMELQIMEKAIAQLGRWYNMGLQPGVLALNLSPRQLQHPEFIDVLEEKLVRHGCRPEWIELEITEGHIMSDPEAAIVFLTKLAEKKVRLAIDDFGTGYSSLSYLKKLPINKLKIDRSFVTDLPDDEEDVTITRTIISLATNLNLQIIAEGVESDEQRKLLIELGCPYLQGYLYSPARPAVEIEIMLENNPFQMHLKN